MPGDAAAADGGTLPAGCQGVSTVPACICSDVLRRRTADGATIGASRSVTAGDLLDARDERDETVAAAAVMAKDSA